MELPSLGTRIRLSGYLGTIRFVGGVDSSQGIWLGVEWDDFRRGKHDGVKDGKRYFDCRLPGSGSFIRPSTLICYGTSFIQALTSKYVEVKHGSQERVVLGSSNRAIEVEAVGLDKIRGKFADLQKLREVSLDTENVARADEPGQIRTTCPGVRGMDLSTSLIPSWDVLAMITAELPLLERLALNRNRIAAFSDDKLGVSAFLKLTELQMNGCLVTWQEMQTVTKYMPKLRILEMGYNQLTQLAAVDSSPAHELESVLEMLNLDTNECNDWARTCQSLKQYPSLQRLILTSNRVEAIPPIVDNHSTLPSLRNLSLSSNLLRSWAAIDELSRWCPCLETLSLSGNPLLEDPLSRRWSRQFTVARIPSLLSLDGSPISMKERADCEIFYLSHVAQHGPGSEEDKDKEHPRWRELCTKHGAPTDAPKRTDNLSNRLIQLSLSVHSSLPPGDTPKSPPLSLRVLPSMTLRAFRLKVVKASRSSARNSIPKSIELWLKMADDTFALLDRDHEDHDLAWWGFENGSELIYHVE